MKTYHKFIKKEYERIFGGKYIPIYKVGDKIKIKRQSGDGMAEITGFEKFGKQVCYQITINWTKGWDNKSEQVVDCKYFDKEEPLITR